MKNIIKTLLVVMTLALLLVAFTGCDLNAAKCEINGHTIVLYGEDLPTCTETGLSAGAICDVCGYVERNRFEIPATGHSFAPATCTVAKTCSVCGATEGEALGHTPVEVAQKDATCTEDGLAAHTACSVCKEIIGEKPATIPATGHTLSDVEGKAATCTEDGYTAHKACACGYTEGKDVISAAHSLVDAEGKAATCTEDGYTAHKTCENCDYVEGKETVPASHSIVDVEAKAATCTADGYNAHKACQNCDYTEGKEVIDSLGHADENGDFKCDRCSTKMLPADGEALTIPQALAIAKLAGTSYTTQKYYITGTIKNVYNTQYGNMYIQDEDGNELCIYGLYTWDKAVRYDAMTYKPVAGDEVTVYTVLGMYNSTCQGKDAWLDEVVAHEHDYKAVVTDPTCTKGGFTTHTCTICGDYYNDSETEATGHTTTDGVCENCGQEISSDAPAYETFTADLNTLSANTSYGSYKTTSGWQATNSCIVQGGSSNSNPNFTALGTAATKGVVLNGKTSAKGKLVSPTLTGGITVIKFNYTNVYSESKGVDITITIKQNGTTVATKKLDNNSVTQHTVYEFVWELDTPVSGDFTIEITNNSPSNSTSNKDRVAIWNIEWTNNPAA